MKNQWRVIVGLLLVLVIVVFAVLNSQNVPVNFGFAKISGPLILIILGSAIIGALVGVITSVTTILDQKKRIKDLIKDKDMYKDETDRLVQEAVEQTERSNENRLAELQQKYDQLLEKSTEVSLEKQNDLIE
ncbi:lipopolysaccharide assembly protein LapA domain-containing protein [uncultured Enterococcus sp.]|uniref:LapA family protein n=1 Tax=uncultured Enterococcus sp. TaxID=167972 RepID=UPI002AA81DFA|nr:lipopolysaccharide assembly protein LapA domain-containing protein [uncultured Enterococcus sp.]